MTVEQLLAMDPYAAMNWLRDNKAAYALAPISPDDEMSKRRIAACLACCEGEEFTIERLESGAFNLRELVDRAFQASEAHVQTTAKLLVMTEQRDELMKRLSSLLEVTLGYQEWIKAIPDDVAAALPTMPGIDGDWAAEVISAAQAANISTKKSVPAAPWARAFGSDYFDALEQKDQLIGLLAPWEDISYRNDMMPSFIPYRFTTTTHESEVVCLKLWCGFHDGNEAFIINASLVEDDGTWLGDLGTVVDLIVMLGADAPDAKQPSSEDALIETLQKFSQLLSCVTPEQEVLLYQRGTR